MVSVGLRIKQLRDEHNMTMDELVEGINQHFDLPKPLSKSMISKWESGKNTPTLENVKYLSLYFGVSSDYLVGISDIRKPSQLLDMKGE